MYPPVIYLCGISAIAGAIIGWFGAWACGAWKFRRMEK